MKLSQTLASDITKLFCEHDLYIEPFCNSLTVLASKAKAEEEIVAVTSPDDLEEQLLPRLQAVRVVEENVFQLLEQYKDNTRAFWFFNLDNTDLDKEKFFEELRRIKGKFLLIGDRDSIEDYVSPFDVKLLKNNSSQYLLATNYRLSVRKKANDYYMVEEDGGIHPALVEYHLRGIWHSDDIEEIKRTITDAKDDPDKLTKTLKSSRVGGWYLLTDLNSVKKDAQEADDGNGDVTQAIRKHFTQDGSEIIKHGASLDKFYNIGNVHVDLRILHPKGSFLIGWTIDTPKIVLQSLNNELIYPLKNRFLEPEEASSMLIAQTKPLMPIYFLTHSVPGSSGQELRPTETPGQFRGATPETAGRFEPIGYVDVFFGVQKDDFHELWFAKFSKESKDALIKLTPDKLKNSIKAFLEKETKVPLNRYDFKQIVLNGKKTWVVDKPTKTTKPYILTHDKKKEEAKAKREGVRIIWNEKLLELLKERGLLSETYKRIVSIEKVNKKLNLVEGVVLTPNKVDRQNDIVLPDEVDAAAIRYAELYGAANEMHVTDRVNVKLVKNFVFPVDTEIDGKLYPAGTWWVGYKIYDETLIEKIDSGKYKAFSIEGSATRRRVRAEVDDNGRVIRILEVNRNG